MTRRVGLDHRLAVTVQPDEVRRHAELVHGFREGQVVGPFHARVHEVYAGVFIFCTSASGTLRYRS